MIAILERLRHSFHPAPEIANETVSIYAELLSEFDVAALAQAAMMLAKTSKWWPAISEIRQACLEALRERACFPAAPDPEILARHRKREADELAKRKAVREEKPPEGMTARETREWYEKRGRSGRKP